MKYLFKGIIIITFFCICFIPVWFVTMIQYFGGSPEEETLLDKYLDAIEKFQKS